MKTEKQHLRTGYTTGTCSAAVAKAVTYMLVAGELVDHVVVTMPDGSESILEIKNAEIASGIASCHTVKDAGDDPDITNGIKIFASAKRDSSGEIKLVAGEGIGKVTKPGLAVEVGKPAINPVPEKMILQAIREVLPEDEGVEVTISIPEGVEIAKRTFNPKLGIIGGISVLGTTGIVRPMSEEALKSSLELHLSQLAQLGHRKVVLVPGNYAVDFLSRQYGVNADEVVQTSNFIGFMLECAVKFGFTRVLLVGHIGKLVKLAGGIFYTHSRVADARNEVLAAHYLEYSKDSATALELMKINTTEEAVAIVRNNGFWKYLAEKISSRAWEYVHHQLEVDVITFSQSKGLLGYSKNAHSFSSEYSELRIDATHAMPELVLCGIGPGNPDLLSQQVFSHVANADVLIGGGRHLSLFESVGAEKIVFNGKLEPLQVALQQYSDRKVVLLLSGDTGFYSLLNYIKRTFPERKIESVPGISSFQYMYARLNMNYENARLLSLHGKETDFVKAVTECDSVFLLTDKTNTYKKIAQTLIDHNMSNAMMYVGDKLSYNDEILFSGTALEVVATNYELNLCSVIIKRL